MDLPIKLFPRQLDQIEVWRLNRPSPVSKMSFIVKDPIRLIHLIKKTDPLAIEETKEAEDKKCWLTRKEYFFLHNLSTWTNDIYSTKKTNTVVFIRFNGGRERSWFKECLSSFKTIVRSDQLELALTCRKISYSYTSFFI